MIWILLAAILATVGYFAWKSTEVAEPTMKMPVTPKMEPVKVEPVVEQPKPEVKKVRKKYGGKVKKTK